GDPIDGAQAGWNPALDVLGLPGRRGPVRERQPERRPVARRCHAESEVKTRHQCAALALDAPAIELDVDLGLARDRRGAALKPHAEDQLSVAREVDGGSVAPCHEPGAGVLLHAVAWV